MEAHRFFADFEIREGDIPAHPLVLDAEESHHAVRVMRVKPGTIVEVINGLGWIARGTVMDSDPRGLMIDVMALEKGEDQAVATLHLAIAPPKNLARLEWFLEKATEIGIGRVSPVQCQHSERVHLNMNRLEKVIRAALKQSRRTCKPLLTPLQPLSSFLDQEREGIRLIAHLDPVSSKPIKDVYSPRENVTVLIGPEGDFSPDELQHALSMGYQGVTLGQARLRTETAALMACAVINTINGQL